MEMPSALYARVSRAAWAQLRGGADVSLARDEVARLCSHDEASAPEEVAAVYQPLARLIGLHREAARALRHTTRAFLGQPSGEVPYIIGVSGSVAVGKSTTSRLLQALLARHTPALRADIVTTDGFLWPNAELARRNLTLRKGFPESYDLRRLVTFLARLKAGSERLSVPVYSHHAYDIVPGASQEVLQPDVVIVEGINVLQVGGRPRPRHFVSDFFDFSVYVDAPAALLKQWFLTRFRRFRAAAAHDATAYFHRYSSMPEAEALALAERVWEEVNAVNLQQNILPFRERARLVLRKGPRHRVEEVLLRHH